MQFLQFLRLDRHARHHVAHDVESLVDWTRLANFSRDGIGGRRVHGHHGVDGVRTVAVVARAGDFHSEPLMPKLINTQDSRIVGIAGGGADRVIENELVDEVLECLNGTRCRQLLPDDPFPILRHRCPGLPHGRGLHQLYGGGFCVTLIHVCQWIGGREKVLVVRKIVGL